MHTHAHWAYTFIYFGIGRNIYTVEYPRVPGYPVEPAAPLPSFMPTHLKVLNESGAAPSFVHHGEKVTALPEPAAVAPPADVEAVEYNGGCPNGMVRWREPEIGNSTVRMVCRASRSLVGP